MEILCYIFASVKNAFSNVILIIPQGCINMESKQAENNASFFTKDNR